MHCVVLVIFARERKEEKPLFKQTLKVTFRPYHELMMFCLACQLLFLTGYYFTIYAKYAGTRLATALRRRPFSAYNKGNRRRLHAGNTHSSLVLKLVIVGNRRGLGEICAFHLSYFQRLQF